MQTAGAAGILRNGGHTIDGRGCFFIHGKGSARRARLGILRNGGGCFFIHGKGSARRARLGILRNGGHAIDGGGVSGLGCLQLGRV